MSRLLALVCLLVSVAVLWLDARESGRVIEGYPLIAALGIMGSVSLLALHIYAEKNTVPATGEEFVQRFLSNLGVATLAEAKRLIGNAVRSDADAKDSRERMRTAEGERGTMRKERDRALRDVSSLQGKLDKLTPRLEELEKAEKARLAAAKVKDTSTQELDGVRKELEGVRNEVTRLSGELGTSTTEVTRLTEELGVAREAHAEAQRKLEEAERTLNTSGERIRECEELLRTRNTRIEELEAELRDIQTAPAVDPEVLVALRREKEEVEARLREVTTAKDEAERWKLDAEPKVETLLKLQPQHAQTLIALGTAERERDEAKAEVTRLTGELETAVASGNGATGVANELRAQLNEQRELVGQKQSEFEAALQEAQGQLGDAIAEIGRLRENPPGLAAAKQTISDLEAKVDELTRAGVTLQAQFNGQAELLNTRARELESVRAELTALGEVVSTQKKALGRIPDLERQLAEAEGLRSRLSLLEMGDRELNGVTLTELREARDAVVAAMDMEELGVRQLNFALVYAMALNPGPEFKALGVGTKELAEYVGRAYEDVLDFNPDRLRSLLHKKGRIPVAAWNHYLRVKKQRELIAEQKRKAALGSKPS